MTDVPERIWLPPEHAEDAANQAAEGLVEYTRAPPPDATLLAAEMQRRAVEVAKEARGDFDHTEWHGGYNDASDRIADSIERIPLPSDTLAAALARPEVRALVEAVEKLGLRKLVAGWNGEDRDTPYTPHPSHLWAKINTTCGVVYEIDAALARVKGETA